MLLCRYAYCWPHAYAITPLMPRQLRYRHGTEEHCCHVSMFYAERLRYCYIDEDTLLSDVMPMLLIRERDAVR